METLSLMTARELASACNDPANPTREAEAQAMRARWLDEIAAGLLIPEPGAPEALSGA